MPPRSPLLLIAALSLVVSGCSGEHDVPTGEQSSHTTRSSVHVRLPVDRPLYGKRVDDSIWRTSGHLPRRVARRPYVNGVLLEGQLSQPVDENGVREYERDGRRYDHPVAIAQYGLAKLEHANRTGSQRALRVARINADRLLDIASVQDRGFYFPYPFDFPLGGIERETINAPWWSAMAQGEALSLFVRLHRATGDEKWAEAADRTFLTMDDLGPRKKPWSVYVDRRHYLWFEEYAGNTRPLVVLNGHMFALFGIWDYERLTGSDRAAQLFDAGVTTLREYLPSFRENGESSYYCLRLPLCTRTMWQNEKYHGIVTRQMRFIADMSDDRWFDREADRYQQDFAGWPLPKD